MYKYLEIFLSIQTAILKRNIKVLFQSKILFISTWSMGTKNRKLKKSDDRKMIDEIYRLKITKYIPSIEIHSRRAY